MSDLSGWDLLEARELHAALKALKAEHDLKPWAGTHSNMGLCYLMLGEPAKAKVEFDEVLKTHTGSDAYGRSGVARWMLGERADAVAFWTQGLKCGYSDAAGGMEMPLLLYYASVRRPDVFSKERAEQLVKKVLKSGWTKNWPGGIGRYMLVLCHTCNLG